jgi:hypothetical protein
MLCLKHCLHQLILGSQELLHLWVVVGIVDLSVAGLTIVVVVPHVHHQRDFDKKYKYFRIESKPQTICCDFYLSLIKDEVVDKVLQRSHDSNQALTSMKTKHQTRHN